LCAARRHYGRNIILDLTRVDGIDAAGVGALISLQAAGVYLKLMNPNKAIREVLRVTGLDSVIEICSSALLGSHKEDARQTQSAGLLFTRLVATAI
jgi:anti-anti-sigma factor